MERYLRQIDSTKYSCVCLHGDRKPHERKQNLEMFKNKERKFLICTDVAARGIDVSGLPFSKWQLIFGQIFGEKEKSARFVLRV